ncbi:helix-turn-helix domain-containing protein [Actinosynnema sp. NPDC020468]|uniref:ArsR/SmtB family transcription factor n=1 Tax=Actinosynnema sp. NPDC020468 TaxID=3154488 RepID=UPI003403C7CD
MPPEPKGKTLDSGMLRALAHPIRVRMLDLLNRDGPATASGLAARLGESSGLASWHLRKLAEHGLIEEDVDRGTQRERWWRPAFDSYRLRIADFEGDPELESAVEVHLRTSIGQRYAAEVRFVDEIGEWRGAWQGKFSFDDDKLSLTPDETEALDAEIQATIARYRRAPREGDAVVITHWAAFPRKGTPE